MFAEAIVYVIGCVCTGLCKVNPVNPHFLAGFRPDLSGEFVPQPLIIPAIEYCTADVVDFLIRFGADLSRHYEGHILTTSYSCQ
mgnify:CR=1 FL=1